VKDFQTLSRALADLIFSLGCHDPKPTRAKKAFKTHSRIGIEAHKAWPRTEPRLGWPDGRRKFGSVGRAIVQVLSDAGGEISVKVIRSQVEQLLDGNVSRFSVADYLLRRSKGRQPLFERTRYGHYRLRRQSSCARS
jgi:hypothetical protein